MSTKATHRLTTAADALTKLLPAAEAEVMRLVWQVGSTTVKQIHHIRAQQRALAYTTTMTTMERLWDKGLLRREPARTSPAYIYTPALSEQEFVAERLADILGAVERDYPAALAQYLEMRPAVPAR
jgi:predicted transcriptional regulator